MTFSMAAQSGAYATTVGRRRDPATRHKHPATRRRYAAQAARRQRRRTKIERTADNFVKYFISLHSECH